MSSLPKTRIITNPSPDSPYTWLVFEWSSQGTKYMGKVFYSHITRCFNDHWDTLTMAAQAVATQKRRDEASHLKYVEDRLKAVEAEMDGIRAKYRGRPRPTQVRGVSID